MEKYEERLNPLNDFPFLKHMSEKGGEEQRLSFLNAVLKKEEAERLESAKIVGKGSPETERTLLEKLMSGHRTA
jgi:hypothetical protein